MFSLKQGEESPQGCWSWGWPNSTCATSPARCLELSVARRPTLHMWTSEEERGGATLPWLLVSTSSSGTSEKERRWEDRPKFSWLGLSPGFIPYLMFVVSFCQDPDPEGPETRGDLPLPFTWWRPHRRGLRGWRRANLQPPERREQRLFQWSQVSCQHHTLWRTGSTARHWVQGTSGSFWVSPEMQRC